MNIKNHIKDAITNLAAFKLRAALAILGILVGTASVVAMVSGGELATREALLQFKNLGTDVLAISINDVKHTNAKNSEAEELNLSTALNLKSASNKIIEVAPYTNLFSGINYKGEKLQASILGATDHLAYIMNTPMLKGRFISYLDKHAFYCVIGNKIYQKIKSISPEVIGKQLKIGQDFFTIIGVMAETSTNASFVYADMNKSIFIPIQTSKLINEYSRIRNIIVKLKPNTNIDQVELQIKQYFEKNTINKSLYIRNPRQFIESMKNQRQILTLFLGLVGSISLIVGGIGVMNIMLVSVTERKREIGIRLAVGAKKRDIQTLFLVEAIFLSLIGGILGVIIGVFISFIIAVVKHWGFVLFFDPPIVGFTVSVFIGIFFGFYPAFKASKLDPIHTLRAE